MLYLQEPGANLYQANLIKTNLSNTNLAGAVVNGADFSASGLTKARLYSTQSYQVKNLRDVKLIGIDLAHGDLAGQDLTNANLFLTSLESANLSGAVLANAKLTQSNLFQTNFTGAVVTGADFSYNGSCCFIKEQLYSTASYKNHDLAEIGLWGNDLTGWNFAGQNLTNARFDCSTLTTRVWVVASSSMEASRPWAAPTTQRLSFGLPFGEWAIA